MDYTSIGNTSIHTQSENDSVKSSNKTTGSRVISSSPVRGEKVISSSFRPSMRNDSPVRGEKGHSFFDTLSNYLPDVKQPGAKDMIEMQKKELREMARMLLEEFRAESEAKRMEIIKKILNKRENDEKDPYTKCMEIFKKLMRGEKVSPEEMNYLMQFDPLLFLIYQMLKDDEAAVEMEQEEGTSEQSAESDADKGSSSIAQAVLTYSPDTTAIAS